LNFIDDLSGACRTGVLVSLVEFGNWSPGRVSANHNRQRIQRDNETCGQDRQQGPRAFPKLVAAQNNAARHDGWCLRLERSN
jgi:hypothetical protein